MSARKSKRIICKTMSLCLVLFTDSYNTNKILTKFVLKHSNALFEFNLKYKYVKFKKSEHIRATG